MAMVMMNTDPGSLQMDGSQSIGEGERQLNMEEQEEELQGGPDLEELCEDDGMKMDPDDLSHLHHLP
ncbi:hypothetical protein PILCRDRAFT_10469 [Piloderma croceum F 1598]|uniref:Uncharacterized protein n=1 Tax=Piloderma croceum (strain F 1598) TaxID=765440 RepID=A0A0C3BPT9_PILCF|nr:hypothetical protein PILCRDRAFT_10469 [Piloderma croceum F 1598]